MYGILIFFHLLVSAVLVLVVLVQQPQKGGMASIMGGGGDSMFGGGGAAPFMAKLTTGLAVAFMLTSLGLVVIGSRLGRSIQTPRPTPAQPATPTQPAQSQPGPLGD
jgi:preprotein translocase subunit SecG